MTQKIFLGNIKGPKGKDGKGVTTVFYENTTGTQNIPQEEVFFSTAPQQQINTLKDRVKLLEDAGGSGEQSSGGGTDYLNYNIGSGTEFTMNNPFAKKAAVSDMYLNKEVKEIPYNIGKTISIKQFLIDNINNVSSIPQYIQDIFQTDLTSSTLSYVPETDTLKMILPSNLPPDYRGVIWVDQMNKKSEDIVITAGKFYNTNFNLEGNTSNGYVNLSAASYMQIILIKNQKPYWSISITPNGMMSEPLAEEIVEGTSVVFKDYSMLCMIADDNSPTSNFSDFKINTLDIKIPESFPSEYIVYPTSNNLQSYRSRGLIGLIEFTKQQPFTSVYDEAHKIGCILDLFPITSVEDGISFSMTVCPDMDYYIDFKLYQEKPDGTKTEIGDSRDMERGYPFILKDYNINTLDEAKNVFVYIILNSPDRYLDTFFCKFNDISIIRKNPMTEQKKDLETPYHLDIPDVLEFNINFGNKLHDVRPIYGPNTKLIDSGYGADIISLKDYIRFDLTSYLIPNKHYSKLLFGVLFDTGRGPVSYIKYRYHIVYTDQTEKEDIVAYKINGNITKRIINIPVDKSKLISHITIDPLFYINEEGVEITTFTPGSAQDGFFFNENSNVVVQLGRTYPSNLPKITMQNLYLWKWKEYMSHYLISENTFSEFLKKPDYGVIYSDINRYLLDGSDFGYEIWNERKAGDVVYFEKTIMARGQNGPEDPVVFSFENMSPSTRGEGWSNGLELYSADELLTGQKDGYATYFDATAKKNFIIVFLSKFNTVGKLADFKTYLNKHPLDAMVPCKPSVLRDTRMIEQIVPLVEFDLIPYSYIQSKKNDVFITIDERPWKGNGFLALNTNQEIGPVYSDTKNIGHEGRSLDVVLKDMPRPIFNNEVLYESRKSCISTDITLRAWEIKNYKSIKLNFSKAESSEQVVRKVQIGSFENGIILLGGVIATFSVSTKIHGKLESGYNEGDVTLYISINNRYNLSDGSSNYDQFYIESIRGDY